MDVCMHASIHLCIHTSSATAHIQLLRGVSRPMQSMHMHRSKYPEPVYSLVRHWDRASDDLSDLNSHQSEVTLVINSIKLSYNTSPYSGSSLHTYNNNVQPTVAVSQDPNFELCTDFNNSWLWYLKGGVKTSLTPHPNYPDELMPELTGQNDNEGDVTSPALLQKLNWLFCPGTMADSGQIITGSTNSGHRQPPYS